MIDPYKLPLGASDEEVARWVDQALIALDERPRDKMWRYRVAGPIATAVGQAPRRYPKHADA